MKLEAIVHPTSISQHDNYFDPSIHIAEEVLSSEEFKQKMVGLPVTAYHHDTMKAVHLIQKRRKELSGENMRMALIELHKNLPSSLQLADMIRFIALPVRRPCIVKLTSSGSIFPFNTAWVKLISPSAPPFFINFI